jgi:hypothetical protein
MWYCMRLEDGPLGACRRRAVRTVNWLLVYFEAAREPIENIRRIASLKQLLDDGAA